MCVCSGVVSDLSLLALRFSLERDLDRDCDPLHLSLSAEVSLLTEEMLLGLDRLWCLCFFPALSFCVSFAEVGVLYVMPRTHGVHGCRFAFFQFYGEHNLAYQEYLGVYG